MYISIRPLVDVYLRHFLVCGIVKSMLKFPLRHIQSRSTSQMIVSFESMQHVIRILLLFSLMKRQHEISLVEFLILDHNALVVIRKSHYALSILIRYLL